MSTLSDALTTRLESLKLSAGNINLNDVSLTAAVGRVQTALKDVLDRVRDSPAYTQATTVTQSALTQLTESVDALKTRGEEVMKTAPSSPMVQQLVDALTAAQSAVQSVKDTAQTRVTATSASITTSAQSALEAVGSALVVVKDKAKQTAASVSSSAASVADSSVRFAVRKAAHIDAAFNVRGRVVDVSKSLKVEELAQRFQVQERVQGLLTRAAGVDTHMTGGRGKALLAFPIEYLTGLTNEFFSARDAAAHKTEEDVDDTTTPAPAAPTPAAPVAVASH